MSKTRLNVRVLKAILFLRFANSDKDKAASLIKEIYTLARTDNRLLEVFCVYRENHTLGGDSVELLLTQEINVTSKGCSVIHRGGDKRRGNIA